MASSNHWAPVNRRRGESADSWTRRSREAHVADWVERKVEAGEWLPPDEYRKLTGRPGKTLTPALDNSASSKRANGRSSLENDGVVAKMGRSVTNDSTRSPLALATTVIGAQAGYGAAFGAGSSVLGDVVRAMNGEEIDVGNAAARAGRSAAEGAGTAATTALVRRGIEAGAGRVFGETTKQAARAAGARVAAETFKGALRSNAIGQTAVLAVDQGNDTIKLISGDIDKKEYGRRSAENVGGAVGAAVGAATGAALGSRILPGVGTVLGGIIGGIAGGLGGRSAASAAVRHGEED